MELIKVFIYSLLLPLIIFFSSGAFQSFLLYLHAIGLTCVAYHVLTDTQSNQQSKGEMYGMRHGILNIQFPPNSLWFNMGLWTSDTTAYTEACERVMTTVIRQSCIESDVGFGCGDSCKYLADELQCKVTGITNEPIQIEAAQATLSPKQKECIELLCGSADDLASLVQPSFDHIVSIDSAYHYNTRWAFFQSAYKKLKQGGTLGLFDFALHPEFTKPLKSSPLKLLIFKMVCQLFQVPVTNLLATPDEYKQRLYDAGFEQVQIQTVEPEDVFGGIAQHIDRQVLQASKYGINVNTAIKSSAFIFRLLATRHWIIPLFASAKKNQKL